MWDERFAGEEYMFGKQPAQALVRHCHLLHQNGTTLAVADGEGRNSVYLAKQGFDVTAMDSSKVGIAKAKKLSAAAKTYDNVVAIFIQFTPPDKWAQIFDGMKSALRPGGCLLLHGYTPKQVDYGTGGPSCASHLYTSDMLAQAFCDMDITCNEAYEAVLDEGPGHKGQSALIDFIAYKR